VQGEAMYNESDSDKVKLPIKNTTYLQSLQNESLLTTIDFNDGGQFLIDEV
jgi:hypothetical protein